MYQVQDFRSLNSGLLKSPGGGTGRRKGLKIPRAFVLVRVQFSSRAPQQHHAQGVALKRQPLLNPNVCVNLMERPMEILITLLKFVPPFVAALILGNWFFKELQKARALRKPWYAPYITTPAIMIITILVVLVSIRVFVY
jgi:hypothetical protein